MDRKKLKKVLDEVKDKLKLDYALCRGFMCPSSTARILRENYGETSTGIYVRWFGKAQEQQPLKGLSKVFINHDLGKDFESKRIEIMLILSKNYDVMWDGSLNKTIRIKEKENMENA